jgi:SAM-dependent methyltransferase
MSEADRRHWDARYAETGIASIGNPVAPPVFAAFEHLFPIEGVALEIACGRGRAALWLASRGMDVYGVDVSPSAIELARALLSRSSYAARARFEVFDLDNGLPHCTPVDLLLCHQFRDARLDRSMMDRLVPGGFLAIATLSEVDAGPGRFRARPGELRDAFAALELLADGERNGQAWLIGRRV